MPDSPSTQVIDKLGPFEQERERREGPSALGVYVHRCVGLEKGGGMGGPRHDKLNQSSRPCAKRAREVLHPNTLFREFAPELRRPGWLTYVR